LLIVGMDHSGYIALLKAWTGSGTDSLAAWLRVSTARIGEPVTLALCNPESAIDVIMNCRPSLRGAAVLTI
jgi:hypothetical protein